MTADDVVHRGPISDEASRACLRAASKLLTGKADPAMIGALPPIVEAASAGAIFVTDLRQRVVYANGRAAALAWDPAAGVLGRTCRDAFRCVNCAPRCPLLQGNPSAGRHVVLRSRAGRDFSLLKSTEVLLDEAGALVGGLEVLHDLSALPYPTPRGACVIGAQERAAPFHRMLGRAPAMSALFDLIERLAGVDANVLVTGESGTGKDLVARALHEAGPRAGRPYHAINCAALPDHLLESELFGHERGAFTGAFHEKPGRLEICEDGTVLLDEIACLPYALQSKLLRVLEDGGFERIGGTRTRQLRARVVAATNANLDALVRQGAFRADLLYRLKVCAVHVPPLRDRAEDVPVLAEHFAATLAPSCRTRDAGFTRAALATLQRHAWPGNVRELRNVVQSALVQARGARIGCEHLPLDLAKLHRDLDRARLEDALARSRFNHSKAAGLLGISRTTLWRHMRRAGMC